MSGSRSFVLASAALLVSACVPTSTSVSIDVSSPSAPVVSQTFVVDPSPLISALPSVSSVESVDLDAVFGRMLTLTPDSRPEEFCPHLVSLASTQVRLTYDPDAGTLTCTAVLPGVLEAEDLAVAGFVSDARAFRDRMLDGVGRAAHSAFDPGSVLPFEAVVRAFRMPFPDPDLVDACAGGSTDACVRVYEASSPGSYAEAVALAGLRDDVSGGDLPALAALAASAGPVDVRIEVVPARSASSPDGTAADGGAVWEFVSDRPGEIRTPLTVTLPEAAPVASSASSPVGPLALALGAVLLIGVAGVLLLRRRRPARRAGPKVKRLPSSRRRRRLR